MNFKMPYVIAVLSAGWVVLSGCNIVNKQVINQPTQSAPISAQVSITTPATATVAPNGELVLEVIARLYNPTSQPMQLFAGTPCAVFLWAVASTDKIIQRKPNQLCAQVVASERLRSYSSLEQRHEIMLDRARYRIGNQYILRYQFWGHDGSHVFTLTDAVSPD